MDLVLLLVTSSCLPNNGFGVTFSDKAPLYFDRNVVYSTLKLMFSYALPLDIYDIYERYISFSLCCVENPFFENPMLVLWSAN